MTITEYLDHSGRDGARDWLAAARSRISADPREIGVLFPAVGRTCGRESLPDGTRVDDAVRALLLTWVPLAGTSLARILTQLYQHGDGDEKRAVIRALDSLDDADHELGDRVLPLIADALRTNDTRLIGAALGEYAARRLDDVGYRQGVLKFVFCEIPLAKIAGLDRRADEELARMLADFARERIAAGRSVPADVWPIIARFPDLLTIVRAAGRT
jgi:hypothetical protein